jgi:hypothetical protein
MVLFMFGNQNQNWIFFKNQQNKQVTRDYPVVNHWFWCEFPETRSKSGLIFKIGTETDICFEKLDPNPGIVFQFCVEP